MRHECNVCGATSIDEPLACSRPGCPASINSINPQVINSFLGAENDRLRVINADLVDALQAMLDWFDPVGIKERMAVEKARAAIAKAKGQQSPLSPLRDKCYDNPGPQF